MAEEKEDREDIKDKVLQISTGKYYIEYNKNLFIYNEPSLNLEMEASRNYKGYYKKAIEEGFLTEEGEKKMLIQNMVWDPSDERDLSTMVEDIKKLKSSKKDYGFQSNKLKAINSAVNKLEEEVTKSLLRKNSFIAQTARYQALQDKFQFIIQKTIEDIHGRLVWATKDDLDNDCDTGKVNFFINRIFYEKLFSETLIRKIARSEPWRTTWKTSSKTGSPLFNKSSSEMTDIQNDLCHWSIIYDSVFESMDCPSHEVINDDELLNEWFIAQHEKNNKGSGSSESSIKNQKIASAQEVFVAVDTPEDAKKVYETMNTPQSRKIIQSRQKALFEKGELKEDELPDVKRKITMQRNQEYIGRMKS